MEGKSFPLETDAICLGEKVNEEIYYNGKVEQCYLKLKAIEM